MNNNIAIPEFNGMVSPRFDFAEKILVVQIVEDRISKKIVYLGKMSLVERKDRLLKENVEVLLCHGIPCCQKIFFESAGIKVYSMISGLIDGVIEAFISNNLEKVQVENTDYQHTKRRRQHGRKRCGNNDNSEFDL
ncbi:MAG: NifB/NifX family molybdenum-iron cluster-binding protein [Oligoflexia bacterium]|nr:NifB/NifX family molybdenum-iron cluster-binding protein [Oligoflexia bacterium]